MIVEELVYGPYSPGETTGNIGQTPTQRSRDQSIHVSDYDFGQFKFVHVHSNRITPIQVTAKIFNQKPTNETKPIKIINTVIRSKKDAAKIFNIAQEHKQTSMLVKYMEKGLGRDYIMFKVSHYLY